jgi:hypothetical protein
MKEECSTIRQLNDFPIEELKSSQDFLQMPDTAHIDVHRLRLLSHSFRFLSNKIDESLLKISDAEIERVFTLEITPERFLEHCSRQELLEVDMLLSFGKYQLRMMPDCEREAWNCPYHACMDGHCQREAVRANGGDFGKGLCETNESNING